MAAEGCTIEFNLLKGCMQMGNHRENRSGRKEDSTKPYQRQT